MPIASACGSIPVTQILSPLGEEVVETHTHRVAARTSLPTETFKQLRHAVLTSLDIADNAENPSDYEDGGLETQENIALESCPSAKEVGKSVFEVSSTLLCVQPVCLQRKLRHSPAAAAIPPRGRMPAARQKGAQPAAGAMHAALPPSEALANSKRQTGQLLKLHSSSTGLHCYSFCLSFTMAVCCLHVSCLPHRPYA